MFSIKGKKILLTGATGGIGQDIARAVHQLGAIITISGTREEALSQIKSELADNVYTIKTNLSEESEVESLINAAHEKMNGLDVLICNAGITDDKLILRMANESWDKIMNVNLRSTFILNRNALRLMSKQKYGRIINMSSIVGCTGNPGQANYVASKAAMIGMTKSIALEFAARNITANCIAPGFIETPMTDKLSDAQKENITKNIPMRKRGTPNDIAAAAIFLMSDEAKYITGQTLHVNGGMYLS